MLVATFWFFIFLSNILFLQSLSVELLTDLSSNNYHNTLIDQDRIPSTTILTLETSTLTNCTFPLPQYQALYELYEQTNGFNWTWSTPYDSNGYPWNFTTNFANISTINNPCLDNWQGITCSYQTTTCVISKLELYDLNLIGSIPDIFMNLTSLLSLRMNYNGLYGKIPLSISNLTLLTILDFSSNDLTGTIPSLLMHLTQLTTLNLDFNSFIGTIPTWIQQLIHLKNINLEMNQLTGSLPSTLSNLTHLMSLNLVSNQLTGSLDHLNLTQWKNSLRIFFIRNNLLSSTLPISFYSLSKLEIVDIDNNLFSGTLSNTLFAQLSSLIYFIMASNQISGSFPQILQPMTTLLAIECNHNLISGNLYLANLQHLISLQDFFLNSNLITGSLPNTFLQLTTLQDCNLQNNFMTGSLLSEFTYTFNQLTSLSLFNNLFSGSIPNSIGYLTQLKYLYLQNNSFTGSIPSSIGQLTLLNFLDLSSNQLIGSITLNNHLLSHLVFIDLSANSLTGEIPSDLFYNTSITFLSLSQNCFVGTLPSSICSHQYFRYLYLNGLHSGQSCAIPLLPGILSSYLLSHAISSTLPLCLLTNLTQLYNLQLAGNGYTGSLPENIQLSSNLINLTLSHNLITGTIPSSFQTNRWMDLDLSFNKLSGILSYPSYFNTSSLTLQENRLSGKIPNSLKNILNINLIRGNMFACSSFSNDEIPNHDEYKTFYSCGSNKIDNALYLYIFLIFLIVFGMLLGYFIYLCYFPQNTSDNLQKDLHLTAASSTTSTPNSNHNLNQRSGIHNYLAKQSRWLSQNWNKLLSYYYAFDLKNTTNPYHALFQRHTNLLLFYQLLHAIEKYCWQLTIVIFLVLMPLYVLLTFLYGSFTHQYAWTISMAYLSGLVPAIILFWVLVGFTYWFVIHPSFIDAKDLQRLHVLPLKTIITSSPDEIEIEESSKDSNKFGNNNEKKNDDHENNENIREENLKKKRKSSQILSLRLNPLILDQHSLRNNIEDEKEKETTMVQFKKDSLLNNQETNEVKDDLRINFHLNPDENNETHIQDLMTKDTLPPEDIIINDQKEILDLEPRKDQQKDLQKEQYPIHSIPHLIQIHTHDLSHHLPLPNAFNPIKPPKFSWQYYLRVIYLIAFILLNITIELTVNMVYVYYITTDTSINVLFALTIIVSGFKLFWSQYVILEGMYTILKQSQIVSTKIRTSILFYLNVFNNVLGPLIALAIVSSECYYYLFASPPKIQSYSLVCIYFNVFTHACDDYLLTENNFTPPFVYSYECSSALIANYAIIVIFRYVISGIVLPCWRIFTLFAWEDDIDLITSFRESEMTNLSSRKNSIQSQISTSSLTHGISGIIQNNNNNIDPLSTSRNNSVTVNPLNNTLTSIDGTSSLYPIKSLPLINSKINISHSLDVVDHLPSPSIDTLTSASTVGKYSHRTHKSSMFNRISLLFSFSQPIQHIHPLLVFSKERFCIILMGDLSLLLTFGVVFPPIALIITLAICMENLVLCLRIGRIITLAKQIKEYDDILLKINHHTYYLERLLGRLYPYMSLSVTLIWSLFLFDILGDDIGLKALGILFMTMLLPWLLPWLEWFCLFLWEKYIMKTKINANSNQTTTDNNSNDNIKDNTQDNTTNNNTNSNDNTSETILTSINV